MANNNIELRNDEVRDILQKMPHWVIRWGITIVFAGLVLLLVFSYIFRYPDLIKSRVVISAQNPPVMLKARATGKITGLFVEDDQAVQENELLAVIENPAKLEDVQVLELYLESQSAFLSSFAESDYFEKTNALTLGQMQPYFAEFTRNIEDYRNYVNKDYHQQQIEALNGQIDKQQELLVKMTNQGKFKKQQLELAAKSFARDSQLFSKTVISPEDYELSRKTLLAVQMDYESLQSSLISIESGIYQLKQNKATLEQQHSTSIVNYKSSIENSFQLLQNSIDNWKLNYLLVSPIRGKVSFNRVWALNQNINMGETVITIVPQDPQSIMGMAYVETKGAGKVQPGQRVNIKLENYPYMEYGMLIGTVKRKAPVPNDELYAIEINLPAQLTTNYMRTLDMQQELWGNCEIITRDLRLVERFLNPIRAVLRGNER